MADILATLNLGAARVLNNGIDFPIPNTATLPRSFHAAGNRTNNVTRFRIYPQSNNRMRVELSCQREMPEAFEQAENAITIPQSGIGPTLIPAITIPGPAFPGNRRLDSSANYSWLLPTADAARVLAWLADATVRIFSARAQITMVTFRIPEITDKEIKSTTAQGRIRTASAGVLSLIEAHQIRSNTAQGEISTASAAALEVEKDRLKLEEAVTIGITGAGRINHEREVAGSGTIGLASEGEVEEKQVRLAGTGLIRIGGAAEVKEKRLPVAGAEQLGITGTGRILEGVQPDEQTLTLPAPFLINNGLSAWNNLGLHIDTPFESQAGVTLTVFSLLASTGRVSIVTTGGHLSDSFEKEAEAFTFSAPGVGDLVLPGPNAPSNRGKATQSAYAYQVPISKQVEMSVWVSTLNAASPRPTVTLKLKAEPQVIVEHRIAGADTVNFADTGRINREQEIAGADTVSFADTGAFEHIVPPKIFGRETLNIAGLAAIEEKRALIRSRRREGRIFFTEEGRVNREHVVEGADTLNLTEAFVEGTITTTADKIVGDLTGTISTSSAADVELKKAKRINGQEGIGIAGAGAVVLGGKHAIDGVGSVSLAASGERLGHKRLAIASRRGQGRVRTASSGRLIIKTLPVAGAERLTLTENEPVIRFNRVRINPTAATISVTVAGSVRVSRKEIRPEPQIIRLIETPAQISVPGRKVIADQRASIGTRGRGQILNLHPHPLQSFERRVRAFISDGTGLPRSVVIPGERDPGPRPKGTFASVKQIEFEQISQPHERDVQTDDGVTAWITYYLRSKFRVRFFNDDNFLAIARGFYAWLDSPEGKLRADRYKFRLRYPVEFMRTDDIATEVAQTLGKEGAQIGAELSPQAIVDLNVVYTFSGPQNIGYIDDIRTQLCIDDVYSEEVIASNG